MLLASAGGGRGKGRLGVEGMKERVMMTAEMEPRLVVFKVWGDEDDDRARW